MVKVKELPQGWSGSVEMYVEEDAHQICYFLQVLVNLCVSTNTRPQRGILKVEVEAKWRRCYSSELNSRSTEWNKRPVNSERK